MMAKFGSWSEYRAAPRHIVEEQLQCWLARTNAEAELANDNPQIS